MVFVARVTGIEVAAILGTMLIFCPRFQIPFQISSTLVYINIFQQVMVQSNLLYIAKKTCVVLVVMELYC